VKDSQDVYAAVYGSVEDDEFGKALDGKLSEVLKRRILDTWRRRMTFCGF
jgi:hypothetical protein